MAVTVGTAPSFAVPKLLFQTRVTEGVSSRRAHCVPSSDGQRVFIGTHTEDALPHPITVVLNWHVELGK